MKKNTFLLLLLTVSLGYSQVVIEDFEGTAPMTVDSDGMVSSTQANPDQTPGTNPNPNASANALQLVTAAAGQPWQGARLLMQNNKIDMTTANKVLTADIYSTVPREFLAKLSNGDVGELDPAQESKTYAAHTGAGWETLTFDFNIPGDTGQPGYNPPNDQFSSILFFPLYDISNDGWCDGCGNANALDTTTYVDNITAIAGDAIIPPAPDPAPAPLPTAPDNETYSIYNDNSGYTTVFPFQYSFGTIDSKPDLDTSAGVNEAIKFDFSFAGYGEGEGGPDDVSAYSYVNFQYYAVAGVPGFQFRLISNTGGGALEYTYEIGTDEAIVTGAWNQVSIPMTYFTNLGFASTHLFQWKFEAFMQVVTDPGIVYVDNIILTQNPLSVEDFELAQVNTFPNPTNSNWNITSTASINTVEVYNVLGKKVMSLTPNTTAIVINASSLNSGLYFARIKGDNGFKTIKLVKE